MRLLSLLLVLPFTGCAIFQSGGPTDQHQLVAQLDREVMALQDQNRRLQEQAANCDEAAADDIYAELHQAFNYSEVVVERDGAITLVRIPGEQLFAPGSVRVRQEAEMVLDLLSTALQSHSGRKVLVVGHTDDQPINTRQYPSNWELSSARAAAFTNALAEDYNVDISTFTVGGRAHLDPIADNATPEGRAANRRIVVHIQPGEN